MKLSKINTYILTQISKYFLLILFIFLSIAWLLQITRLFTITNFMYIEITDILILSLYLLPNIITIIVPFILIFGLLLCFIKLNKDNELIAILSLGLGLKPFKNALLIFGVIVISFFSFLNLYLAPKVYKIYKIEENNLRNTLDFNNITFSNFLNLDKTTVLDFKKENNEYQDLFISFFDEKENIIYAKRGNIFYENNLYNFKLSEGFKISIDENNQIEKLEFVNYILKIENKKVNNVDIIDKNTLTIFDDIYLKNYLNISFKILDTFLIIFVFLLFYVNNLQKINFKPTNNIYFVLSCAVFLIVNQIFKNSETDFISYITFILIFILLLFTTSYLKKKYEQN